MKLRQLFFAKLFAILVALLFVVNIALVSTAAHASQRVTPNTLPANENATSIIEVEQFGRYIIQAKSDQGVAFGINDKKYGKSELFGMTTKTDGRYSGFLDVGQYQLFTHTHSKNTGNVTFNIYPSKALNTQDLLDLPDGQLQTLELNNLQHYDWAINITTAQQVDIEAAGRNLEHLQLFENGQWLVESKNTKDTIDPQKGQPLTRIRMSVYLQPGLYRLSAYGGVSNQWANEADNHPLYVRKGVEKLNVNAKDFLEISPFGEDFYLVEKGSDFFQVNLANNAPFELGVADYSNNNKSVFLNRFNRAYITKKSATAEASITKYESTRKIVSVKGEVNQKFEIVNFKRVTSLNKYYTKGDIITTISANNPLDYADITGYSKDSRNNILSFKAIEVDHNQFYQRKFNVLKKVEMLVHIKQAGKYELINNNNLDVKYKIEPMTLSYKKEKIPYKDSSLLWDLNVGLYKLSIDPKKRGILDLTIKHINTLNPLVQSENSANIQSPYHMFWKKDVNSQLRLTILDNGNINGIINRKQLAKFDAPITLYLTPKESVDIESAIYRKGHLAFNIENTNAISLTVNGRDHNLDKLIKYNSLTRTFTFTNTSNKAIGFTVKIIPAQAQAPKWISQTQVNHKISYDNLDVNTQPFIQLKGEKIFSMQVDQPGLYSVQSTGLLSTTGAIRNKVNDQYQDTHHNGAGRNFYIQPYLLAGEYQLRVNTQLKSNGNLGVKLAYSASIDKAEVKLGAKYYENIKSTESLRYELNVPQSGRYRIQSYGVDQTMNIRLDDQDGWPVLKPYSKGDQTLQLNKGKYFITILPKSIDQLSSLLVEQVTLNTTFAQNNDVKKLNNRHIYSERRIDYTWLEREDASGQRIPDRWQFSLNTPADITINYSNEMNVQLIDLSASKPIAMFDVNENYNTTSWSSNMKAGDYELVMVAKGKNNRLDYSFSVNNQSMIFGHKQTISLPYQAKFELDQTEQINFSTYGMSDVRAKLFDQDNQLIKQFDDTQKNWNVLINEVLPAGTYRIELSSISQKRSTNISFDKSLWQEQDLLSLPIDQQITNDQAVVLPLLLLDDITDTSVLNVVASSKQSVYVVLEQLQFNDWKEVAKQSGEQVDILLPLRSSPKPLRLKIYSLLSQPLNIQLKAEVQNVPNYDADAFLQFGITGKKILSNSKWYVAKITDIKRSGFTFNQEVIASYSASDELKDLSAFIYTQGDQIWLAAKNASIEANMEYLQDTNQIQLQPESHATLITHQNHNTGERKVSVTLANVVQGVASIYYQSDAHTTQNTMAVDQKYSVTSTLNVPVEDQSLMIKNAVDSSKALLVKLQHFEFNLTESQNFEVDYHSILDAQSSFTYALPDDQQDVEVILPANTLLQMVYKDQIQASFFSHKKMKTILYQGQADSLVMFSLNDNPKPFSITKVSQLNGNGAGLNAVNLNVQKSVNSEQDILNAESKRLNIKITHNSVVIDKNMNVHFGKEFHIQNDAKMYIDHNENPAILWASPILVDVTKLKKQSIELTDNQTIDKAQYFDMQNARNHIVSLKTDQLVSVEFISHTKAITQQLIYPFQQASFFVGADLAFIKLQSLNAEIVNVNSQISVAKTLSQGVNDVKVIASAQSHLYEFRMTHDGKIGFANRSDNDQLTSQLYDESGKLLVQGNVLMHPLTQGRYFIVITNKPSNQASQYQPVLLGVTPNNALDINTINEYKQKAGWVK